MLRFGICWRQIHFFSLCPFISNKVLNLKRVDLQNLAIRKKFFMVTVVRHCNGPNIQSDLSLTQLEKRDGEVEGSQARKLAWEIQN